MTLFDRGVLTADLRDRVFAPLVRGAGAARLLGAEVELIPVEAATGRRCPIQPAEPGDDAAPATLPFLRRYGAALGWNESVTDKGSPCFTLPEGTLTFEPGGQLEFSSAPASSARALLGALHEVVPPLRAAAAAAGIVLLATGIDPFNDLRHAPLLIQAPRYLRMADYLARIGAAGARMMRQTAAFQLSVDLGESTWLRWRVLNALAPYLTGIFANSAVYNGAPAGGVSARAEAWRSLDPLRTGLPYGAERPLETYLDFALAAPAILLPQVGGSAAPFSVWLERGVGRDAWEEHLSTLFPEIRPGGRFEVRSPDAIEPEWYAAPLVLVAGIAYEPTALHEAALLLGEPDLALLGRAGRIGLHDPSTATTANSLVDIALRGAQALGDVPDGPYFSEDDLARANLFFDRYTRRGRAPADDAIEGHAPVPVSGITLARRPGG